MARSERYAVAALGCLSIAACNAIAGLGDFQEVPCEPCVDAEIAMKNESSTSDDQSVGPIAEAGADVRSQVDAQPEATTTPDDAAGEDATDDVLDDAVNADDGEAGDASTDAGVSVDRRWARWVMPNSAEANGDGGAALPNQARYRADTEGNVEDLVTSLVWSRTPVNAATLTAATGACVAPWRVPTRIELISILDTARTPTVNAAFDVGAVTLWTASSTSGGTSWTIDFGTGSVVPSIGSAVLCVQGGP